MVRFTFRNFLSVRSLINLTGRPSESQLHKEDSAMIDITLCIAHQHVTDVIDLNIIDFAGS